MNLDHIQDIDDTEDSNTPTAPAPVTGCPELRRLLEVEVAIMRKHLDRHKWFRHLADDNEASLHFVHEYGWLMKEIYCACCKLSETCEHAKSLREGEIERNPNEP